MSTDQQPAAPTPVRTVDLAVEGMTCASCVARVEKRLNRVPGARATVNLALESAHVEVALAEDGSTPGTDALVEAGRAAGYDAEGTRPFYTSDAADGPLRVCVGGGRGG